MDIKYMKTFKTILETGSFQKAAERLNYAQSTVTLQIQSLEQELSVKLFDKIGRKMQLTQAGQDLVPYIDAVLDAVQKLDNYGKSKDQLTGTLRVAVPETLLTYKLQPVLKEFREQAPDVRLSLDVPNCYVIQEQVKNGSVDLGIHYDIGGYGAQAVVEPLAAYPLALTASPDLRKEDLDFIQQGQRKDICLLTVDRHSIYHKIFHDYLRESDIVLNGEMEIRSVEAAKRSAASNLGVAYLPRYAAEDELQQGILKELPIRLKNPTITAVCVYHKKKWVTPAMELFLQLLREYLLPEK